MAKVSKRTWKTSKGEPREGWALHYVDANGKQHRKLFKLKREAEIERVRIETSLSSGNHVSDRGSRSIGDAADAFLADYQVLVDTGKRERSTLRGYRQHIELHIKPFPVAGIRLSRLSGPDCTDFARELEKTRSDAMARRVFGTFRRILDFSVSRGWLASNVATSVAVRTAGSRARDSKLEVPTKAQLKALLGAATRQGDGGRTHALVSVLIFAGLRASELRGLRWSDVDFDERRVQVQQRADRWQKIGPVKTQNSRRTIPIPTNTATALRKWRMSAPVSKFDLVFPSGTGRVESYANIYNRIWCPLMNDAGLADVSGEGDATKVKPWFGLHALRHVCCSLWIEQGADAHHVKTWAGHARVQFTYDVYGHLWHDTQSEQSITTAIERSVLS